MKNSSILQPQIVHFAKCLRQISPKFDDKVINLSTSSTRKNDDKVINLSTSSKCTDNNRRRMHSNSNHTEWKKFPNIKKISAKAEILYNSALCIYFISVKI